MPHLRPYQREIARAILSAIHQREGLSLSVEIARQGGKNETSSQIEIVTLLANAGVGGAIIKAAPTEDQAAISGRRLAERATQIGTAGDAFRRSGDLVWCGNAHIEFVSAQPDASVVGRTASLLLEVDEAQDVLADKFDRDFRPMAASTAAPTVFWGTPWAPNSLLLKMKAHHIELEKRDGIKRHFRYDWTAVGAQSASYRRYVEDERARLGEDHPLFRTQYLLEVVNEADRMFTAAAIAALPADYARLSAPRPGERYVAGLDLAGAQTPEQRAAQTERDRTVLTIGRVRPNRDGNAPSIQVVEQMSWMGDPTEELVAQLADRLGRVWRVGYLAIDATGLGGPIADLLTTRLRRTGMREDDIERVVYTRAKKSELGWALMAAVGTARLQWFAPDGSFDFATGMRELELLRATYLDERTVAWSVDETEGHDDYANSTALLVRAAEADRGPRVASGR